MYIGQKVRIEYPDHSLTGAISGFGSKGGAQCVIVALDSDSAFWSEDREHWVGHIVVHPDRIREVKE